MDEITKSVFKALSDKIDMVADSQIAVLKQIAALNIQTTQLGMAISEVDKEAVLKLPDSPEREARLSDHKKMEGSWGDPEQVSIEVAKLESGLDQLQASFKGLLDEL